jgi:hypothetical protein
MEPIKGLIQVSGVYKDGRVCLEDEKCPFQAELGQNIRGMASVHITLLVPRAKADDVLSGLSSGADLTLDNIPNLIDRDA